MHKVKVFLSHLLVVCFADGIIELAVFGVDIQVVDNGKSSFGACVDGTEMLAVGRQLDDDCRIACLNCLTQSPAIAACHEKIAVGSFDGSSAIVRCFGIVFIKVKETFLLRKGSNPEKKGESEE